MRAHARILSARLLITFLFLCFPTSAYAQSQSNVVSVADKIDKAARQEGGLYLVSAAAELEPMSRLAHFRFPGEAAYDYTGKLVEYASFAYDADNRLIRESYYDFDKNEIGSWHYEYKQYEGESYFGNTHMIYERGGSFYKDGVYDGIHQWDYCDRDYTYIRSSSLHEGTGTRYSETYDRDGHTIKRVEYYSKWKPATLTEYDSDGKILFQERFVYDESEYFFGDELRYRQDELRYRIFLFYQNGRRVAVKVYGDMNAESLLASCDANNEFIWYLDSMPAKEKLRILTALL